MICSIYLLWPWGLELHLWFVFSQENAEIRYDPRGSANAGPRFFCTLATVFKNKSIMLLAWSHSHPLERSVRPCNYQLWAPLSIHQPLCDIWIRLPVTIMSSMSLSLTSYQFYHVVVAALRGMKLIGLFWLWLKTADIRESAHLDVPVKCMNTALLHDRFQDRLASLLRICTIASCRLVSAGIRCREVIWVKVRSHVHFLFVSF